MLIAFIASFGYYLAVNQKNNNIADLVRKKSFLIFTFITFLLSWLIVSTYITDITDINKSLTSTVKPTYTLGSSYDINAIIKYALFPFTGIDNFFDGLKLFLYHIDYTSSLLLSTYFDNIFFTFPCHFP
jgi:hypothetical protein